MKMTKYVLIVTLLIVATGFSQRQRNTFLWLDAHANFKRLGTEEGVGRIFKAAKSTGFENIILDLRGIDGYVLYPSKIAPVLHEHNGYKRAADYNYPAVVMNAARKLGLGVYFAVNVFSEGNKESHLGLGYNEHSDWQVQVYTKDGIVPISESKEEIAVFVNPILPAVRKYELSIIEELLTMYKPDGLILDRTRYPNISGDFSNASKSAFERFIGNKVSNWPDDIYRITVNKDSNISRIPGKFYKPWLAWRARVIHDFFAEVKKIVKSIDPSIKFSDYVGSWYPVYYDVGVNWAGDTYHAENEYDWADSSYYRTGYAQMLNFLFVGNYFYEITKDEAVKANTPPSDSSKTPDSYWWYSIEGSANVAMKAVDNAAPIYGSLWAHQYIEKNNPEQFVRAMKELLKDTNGLMIFDVSEIDECNWWQYINQALKN